MQIEQTFEIPSGADRVWRWFNDIEAVVACLPGASLRAPLDGGKLQLAMAVKLGPITAYFVGDGEVRLDDATRSGTVTGGATDRKSGSRIKGQVAFTLSERAEPGVSHEPLTRVTLAIEYTIGGALAQFSREGIVRDLARRLSDAFASNLRQRLEAADDASDSDASTLVCSSHDGSLRAQTAQREITTADSATADLPRIPAQVHPQPVRPAPLDFGALLWAAMKERLWRLFHRRPRHWP